MRVCGVLIQTSLACLLAMLLVVPMSPALAGEPPAIPREALMQANYRQGMLAFQTRCSACHSLADGGTHLVGPNLYGVFKRRAGGKADFNYSAVLEAAGFEWTPARLAAWIADPVGYLKGSSMMLPQAVPEQDRVALLSYLMLETGAADWPRPSMPRAATAAANASLAERYPSFWNHLMSNTTRYKIVGPADVARFDAYFNTNGTVTSDVKDLQGFWREMPGEQFCYALMNVPSEMRQLVECFPIVAMSIPRFREELWTTSPAPGFQLTGGIVAGRPEAAAAPGTAKP